MIKTLLLIAALSLAVPQTLSAQGISSDGREYFLGMLYPSFNSQNAQVYGYALNKYYNVYALVSAIMDCSVKVFYYDSSGNETLGRVYSISAHKSVQILLDTTKIIVKPASAEQALYRTCHIVSNEPIAVHFFSYGACSGGSYLALPIECWGRQYVVESYHDNIGGIGGGLTHEDAAGCFEVIASQDSTNVTITPTTLTSRGHIGASCGTGADGSLHPFMITLQRGQCYLVRSAAQDIGVNISGTTVVSDKPVAVVAGNENAITDGSNKSPGGSRPLDARNFMIQQMLPVEIWDSTGYYSIPFVGSKVPVSGGGTGDEYDFFTGIIPQLHEPGLVKSMISVTGAPLQVATPVSCTIPSLVNITSPLVGASTDDTRIHVVQYDQREHGSGAPYPTPSEMCLVPQSRWKRDYSFDVPSNNTENLQGYYINLICIDSDFSKGKIKISFNAQKASPIAVYTIAGKFNFNFGGAAQSHLMGIQFQLGTMPCYIYADSDASPFMVYNYGDRALDADNDLGDFDDDDMFFSYAEPTGLLYKQFGTIKPTLSATVINTCNSWTVCVSDKGDSNTGIRYIELLNYSNLNFARPSMPLASNVEFDHSLDSLGKGDIVLPGTDKNFCFTINPIDLSSSSRAVIAVYDNSGTALLLDLNNVQPFRVTASSGLSAGSSLGLKFSPLHIDSTECSTVVITNTDSLQNRMIDAIHLGLDSSHFTITSLSKALPIMLAPNDSLSITICFSPSDTTTARCNIILSDSCTNRAYVGLSGIGKAGIINATDAPPFRAYLGDTTCEEISISNVGTDPFVLGQGIASDTSRMEIDPNFLKSLPITIQPGTSVNVYVCVKSDSTGIQKDSVVWKTNIESSVSSLGKSVSYLPFTAYRGRVNWQPDSIIIHGDSTAAQTPLLAESYLVNDNLIITYIQAVGFRGADSAEFSLTSDALNQLPFEGFHSNPGDSLWAKIAFIPDFTKPYPNKFADRHADLYCVYHANATGSIIDTTIAHLTATFDVSLGDVNSNGADAQVSAAINGRTLIIEGAATNNVFNSIELYDVVGRKVAAWKNIGVPNNPILLPLPPLPSGMYVVRLTDDAASLNCKVMKN